MNKLFNGNFYYFIFNKFYIISYDKMFHIYQNDSVIWNCKGYALNDLKHYE